MPPVAALVCLLCSNVRADDSCAALANNTGSAERALQTLDRSEKSSKAALRAAARALEIASKAAPTCRDHEAKTHLVAVQERLTNALLAAGDADRATF